ncbi:molybdenum cofactor guanylyltransferase [Aneurinibacillus aneurinilyticus]|jgi:molybdopterin-guanine dinucleotide biosynthesis protein A|uniref:Probable molybdenum cofactor guanylyltransferase n=1 Tax=Aneurinibacillus aneurinilyticus TaxID=1391 RepID=A0A848D027_ANEAE|nr:molybdenum cofactor guanylyltransferase [Aneurinibacillus aneurinilyticus]MCI1695483.1 molybdenum cofactor guanylyltransferase [Aneurinibacillus aneurinilyticus]NMF00719.1 molybdenum cofactor guanylyltransferase [Aneurinibacillus aneurinilyticus]
MEGIILAGGHSSRMGQPKELLLVEGVPLIERTRRLLTPVMDRCVIISNHPERLKMIPNEVPIYPDDIPGQGPLGGIVTAMRVATSDILFVVACDMPALEADVVLQLCDRASMLEKEYDIIYPVWSGRAHPLCALYHRRVWPFAEALLKDGRRRMFDLIDGRRAFAWDATLSFPTDPFCNINTVQDYDEFQKGERV